MSAVNITAKSNEAYELNKISGEATYMLVNQWLNVWKHGQVFHVLSYIHCLHACSDPDAAHKPTTEAATLQPPAGDSLYEPT